MKKKKLPTPPKPPGTRKYSSVTRIHFYIVALSTLRNWSGWLGRLADWLIDWLTEKASRQTANFAAYCSKTLVSYLAGGVCGSLILSYISRFCPFYYIFCWGGGGGQEIRKINMFGDMMKLWFIFLRFGGSFLSIWGFLRSMFRFGKCFWGRLSSNMFWVCLIFLIFWG